LLQKYFEPYFEANDLIQQHNRYFVATMTIGGEKAPAFSAKTLNLPPPQANLTAQIVELSRQRYTQERPIVEEIIRQATGMTNPAAPDAILAPEPKPPTHVHPPKLPSPSAQTEHIGKVATNIVRGEPAHLNSATQKNHSTPSKRRRRRSRRKKPGHSSPPDSQRLSKGQASPPTKGQPLDEERIISLR